MTQWFLSTRAQSVGGPVGSVKVIDGANPGGTTDRTADLIEEIRGREVFFVAHGYNVNQADGIAHLGFWLDKLDAGDAVKIGILWPGDCVAKIFVDYVVEGHEAIKSGKLLAAFISDYLSAASSLSFASHSLGARVVLQTIEDLDAGLAVRRLVVMAGALDETCLTSEYKTAAARVGQISVLASRRDTVLELAYPLGNFLQGIIDRGHPYWHAALGREGPSVPYLAAPQMQRGWMIPENLDYNHSDYIPGAAVAAAYALPVEIPLDNGPVPPAGTPGPLMPPAEFKSGWSAGFVSTRLRP